MNLGKAVGNALDAAQIVADLIEVAAKVPDALAKIHAWVNGGEAAPLDVLPELPDLTRNHLEHAAMIQRARKAGNIP